MIASTPSDFTDKQGLAWSWVVLRASGFGAYVLADPEAALDQAVSREDWDAPYFGTVWPSGRVLAEQILDGRIPLAGRVCDLGCGNGVAGLAASCMGADVTFVDIADRAFPGVQAAAHAMELPEARCVQAHWELDVLNETFDAIVATDVLYHQIAVLPVARWALQHLAPGGSLWIADPGRPPAKTFPAAAAKLGLQPGEPREPVRDIYSHASVTISQYRRKP